MPGKWIEYGWNSPSTLFARDHSEALEKSPFDGAVLRVLADRSEGEQSRALSRQTFSPELLDADALSAAVDDMRATRFSRMKDSFLQMVASPVLDWFDPRWEVALGNVRALARAASDAGVRGLMLDLEDYAQSGLWSYKKMSEKSAKARSRNEYAARIREVGLQMIQAIESELPAPYLLCLLGPSFSLIEELHGLLMAFYDGMLEAASDGTVFSDGAEQVYGKKDRKGFVELRKQVMEEAAETSAVPDRYRRHVRLAPAVWIDYWSHEKGWHSQQTQLNYYTPQEFEDTCVWALEAADDYAWVYSQKPNWYQPDMPQSYVQALLRSKERAQRTAL